MILTYIYTCDVLGGLHDEDDGDQEREDLVREAREEQHHVGQREHAVGHGHGHSHADGTGDERAAPKAQQTQVSQDRSTPGGTHRAVYIHCGGAKKRRTGGGNER